MRKSLLATIVAVVALTSTGAHAEPPEYTNIKDFRELSPTVQFCWNTDHYEVCQVGDVSGSTVNLGSIGTAATAANQTTANTSLGSMDSKLSNLQCIAPAASTKAAYSAVSGSSTTVDAGCTGNVALYMKATNLSRTFDVKFSGPDGGSGRIPPSGVEFFCKSGSATADSITFDATCDTCNTGRVSVTAGCVN